MNSHALKTITVSSLTTIALTSLSGCANQQQITDKTHSIEQQQFHASFTSTDTKATDTKVQLGVNQILAAAIGSSTQTTTPQQPVGPQLVAGDWLAFQCAIAGGYWSSPSKYNNDHAPQNQFATVIDQVEE